MSKVPVIFVSSASDNMNIVMAMNMGGDDFISKPFDLTVMVAKIQALLRRSYSFSGTLNVIEHQGVILNLNDATVEYQQTKIELTKNEFKILQLLLENKSKIVSREEIMECLWLSDSFIDDNTLMRSHTSPVQAHVMEAAKGQAPIKIICPGKVFRRDEDATHSHQFGQIECLVIDKNVNMGSLMETLTLLIRHLFGEKREVRFRPSYFPFTEPSIEVDVSCFECGGKGCKLCKHTGWIEILGGGMVHPNVLRMNGFDDKEYQGFAFGVGIERLAMLKYGIDDIRRFYTDDVNVLNQFNKE